MKDAKSQPGPLPNRTLFPPRRSTHQVRPSVPAAPPSAGVRGVPALLPARLRGAPEPRSPAERPSNPWQSRRNGGLRDAEVCARRQRHQQHAGHRSAAAGASCGCSVGSSDSAAAALRDRNHRSPPADGSARQGSPAPCTARLGCARQVRRSSPIAATRCCPTSYTPARIACPRLALANPSGERAAAP